MIAASLVALVLGGSDGATFLGCSLDLGAALEYSTFLDVHRRAFEEGGTGDEKRVSPFALQLHLALRQGSLALGASGSLYPGKGMAGSVDFFLAWVKQMRWLSLLLGGGVGTLITTRETLVPTYTDTVTGPSVHLRGHLRVHLMRAWYVGAGLGVYVYPSQPLFIVPVGIDLRWTVGLGLML